MIGLNIIKAMFEKITNVMLHRENFKAFLLTSGPRPWIFSDYFYSSKLKFLVRITRQEK